jgi:hypothetical protein
MHEGSELSLKDVKGRSASVEPRAREHDDEEEAFIGFGGLSIGDKRGF